jgi:Bacteriophage Mu Gp45 spike protein
MHRVSPVAAAFRSYSSGGARSVVDKVNDGKLMQEMGGNFMKGETQDKVESPQNYGFTSTVMPAEKGGDGKVSGSAEAFMSFIGGNRSFPVAGIMDDRRFRPMGLKPGENSQYDNAGQMTLMRKTGLYLLSLDDEQQQQGGGGSKDSSSGGGDQQQGPRMVSLRHVVKKKQERQKSGQAGPSPGTQAVARYPMHENMTSAQREAVIARRAALREKLQAELQAQEDADAKSKEDFKHEGETVNTEVRCTKGRIEFRTGDKVVGYFDVQASKWYFEAATIHNKATSEVKDEAPKISHN